MGGLIATIISSELFLKFFSTVLDEKIKEIIKRKDSLNLAKTKVLNLYQNLVKIERLAARKVKLLKSYLSLIEDNKISLEEIDEISEKIRDVNDQTLKASSNLLDSIDALYPQLEIHEFELYQLISKFKQGEFVIFDFEEEVEDLMCEVDNTKNFDKVKDILKKQQDVWQEIKNTLERLRAFIKETIPFKDSF